MRPIDHHSPVPYYYQLADILREAIDRGTWEVDELIPAEGTLTEMFGVSRSVTRKALDLLEGEGRVLRVKGKGTLVVAPKFAYEAVDAAGNWFAQRGHPLRLGKIISAGRSAAGGHLGKLLDLSPRDQVWEIALTHELDGAPVALSQMYLRIQGTLTVGAPPTSSPGVLTSSSSWRPSTGSRSSTPNWRSRSPRPLRPRQSTSVSSEPLRWSRSRHSTSTMPGGWSVSPGRHSAPSTSSSLPTCDERWRQLRCRPWWPSRAPRGTRPPPSGRTRRFRRSPPERRPPAAPRRRRSQVQLHHGLLQRTR